MTVNSAGFLDEEWVVPKPEGVIRIAVLTGSIANDGAIPFEDRFFRVLERLLTAAAPGVEVEVLNLSCEGHNTLQQVRRLEQVGLQYEPDLVFVGFMVTAAGFQNGGHRRIGNSYFAFRFIPMLAVARGGSICSLFSDIYETYTFDLIVGNSLERLKLLGELHGFETAFAPLPMLEELTHPACQALYTRATDVARAAEYDIIPVVERFEGRDFWDFVKEGSRWDFAHPNVAGHLLIGEAIAEDLGPWVREQTAVAP
jgi:hypothetical protein